jgi:hypothetical protein
LAGVAIVGPGTNYTFELTNEKQDAGLTSRLGKHSQPTKCNGKLMVDLSSISSGSTRVSHVNVTAFTIGGTSYLDVLKDLTLSCTYDKVMQAGVGEKYGKPQVVAKDFQIAVNLDVDTGDAKTFFDMIAGADFSNVDQAVSFTLNSVVVTIPMNLNEGTLTAQRYSLQSLALAFDGADPGAGNYPTAPTGTTTILEKALNAATTEMAFSFQNALAANTGGIAASGTCVFDSVSIKIADGQLVEEQYGFATYGAVTIAASS